MRESIKYFRMFMGNVRLLYVVSGCSGTLEGTPRPQCEVSKPIHSASTENHLLIPFSGNFLKYLHTHILQHKPLLK